MSPTVSSCFYMSVVSLEKHVTLNIGLHIQTFSRHECGMQANALWVMIQCQGLH